MPFGSRLLRSRMSLVVNRRELVQVEMRVALRRGETRVAQQLLNDPEVRAAIQQMRRERMAQPVRPHAHGHLRGFEIFIDDGRDAPSRDSSTAMRSEEHTSELQ